MNKFTETLFRNIPKGYNNIRGELKNLVDSGLFILNMDDRLLLLILYSFSINLNLTISLQSRKIKKLPLNKNTNNKIISMAKKIDKDHARFRQIIRGKVKKNLRKYITQGELIGKKGKDIVELGVYILVVLVRGKDIVERDAAATGHKVKLEHRSVIGCEP